MNNNILIRNGGKTIAIEITDSLREAGFERRVQQMFRQIIQNFGKIIQRERAITVKKIHLVNGHRRFQQTAN